MMNRYESAKKQYAKIGVDTDEVIKKLGNVSLSMHCWQGDDVMGFEGAKALSGGIAATGGYPGRAETPDQLMRDIDKALSMIPGVHRLNLHAMYAFYEGEPVERNVLLPKHFEGWIDFARERGMCIDINPTLFSHQKAEDNLTLSSPDPSVRKFWVEHCIAIRRIAEHIGRVQGSPCLCNIWIPDGYKNPPADRLAPRRRLLESLDEIYAEKLNPKFILDSVESKVFGIGLESYTVGSHEFYLNYAQKNNILCLLDNGHYHPTESVSDKIPSMLLFFDKIALHVTRPVRWDSDHVVLLSDEVLDIAREIVRCDALDKTLIGLDYFDASINRVAAWVIGMRNMQKAILMAMLEPLCELKKLQNEGDFTRLMYMAEEMKSMPFGDVWDRFCAEKGVTNNWFDEALEYEDKVLRTRGKKG